MPSIKSACDFDLISHVTTCGVHVHVGGKAQLNGALRGVVGTIRAVEVEVAAADEACKFGKLKDKPSLLRGQHAGQRRRLHKGNATFSFAVALAGFGQGAR